MMAVACWLLGRERGRRACVLACLVTCAAVLSREGGKARIEKERSELRYM